MLFILFFVSYGYFFQGGGWNQNSRICLTRAIIHHGSFKIDYFKEDSKEMEFVNTGDWAFCNGHYYSNKSPGLSFLAVPSFALAEYCLKYLLPNDPERQVLLSAYFSTLCTTALFSTLLCLLIFHLFNYFFQMSMGNSLFLTLLYGFGTLAFSYSTTFYSHQPAAFCSFFSFVLVLYIRYGNLQKKGYLALLAGFSSALAVVIEPSTFLMLGAVLIYLVSFKENRKYIPFFILGCFPPRIVQAVYNFICFGNPFSSSYHYANDMVMWRVDGKLFGIPRAMRFFHLLFSAYRGVFFSSPIFIMALPGIYSYLKDRKWRVEAIFCVTLSVFFIILIASFHAWHGGSTPGPRYLLPLFPFIFLIAGFSLSKFPSIFKVVGVVSLLINLSITMIGNEIPRKIKNPLGEIIFKNVISGNVSINPVPFSHFENYDSIYELAEIEQWKPNFNSFNLGEIIFPHSLASILPLICFWTVWGFCWKRFIQNMITRNIPRSSFFSFLVHKSEMLL